MKNYLRYLIIASLGVLLFLPLSKAKNTAIPQVEIEQKTLLVEPTVTPVPTEVPVPTPTPEVDIVKENPQGCNTETQWIWSDGSCHDKDVINITLSTRSPNGSCESYRSLLSQYGWNVDTMMYAMQKESGCNPNAVGDNRVIGGVYAPSCGLLQVRTLPGRPSCTELQNPATNIATAYKIWLGQGYSAWSVLK